MAGAKYSPGFDDPSAHRKAGRSRTSTRLIIAVAVAVAIIGSGAVGVIVASYLSPAIALEIGGLINLGAGLIGLR